MTAQPVHHDDRQITLALDELRELIVRRYPDAKFDVGPAP